jgi:hypothetical protein
MLLTCSTQIHFGLCNTGHLSYYRKLHDKGADAGYFSHVLCNVGIMHDKVADAGYFIML